MIGHFEVSTQLKQRNSIDMLLSVVSKKKQKQKRTWNWYIFLSFKSTLFTWHSHETTKYKINCNLWLKSSNKMFGLAPAFHKAFYLIAIWTVSYLIGGHWFPCYSLPRCHNTQRHFKLASSNNAQIMIIMIMINNGNPITWQISCPL